MNISTKKILITLLIAMSLILVSGCTEDNATQIPAPQDNTNMPTQTSSVAYSAGELNLNPSVYSRAEISGKVVETMNSGGYTYVQLDDGTGTAWAAIPQTIVSLGAEGTVTGSIMNDFPSSTLGRTFAAIIFSDGMQSAAVSTPTNEDIIGSPASYNNVIVSGTANQTMDASGYTYIEIDDGTGLIWAAVSQTDIAIGDNVTVGGGTQSGFESLTLNKTFDVLIMGTLVTDDETASAESDDSAPVSPHGF